MNRKRDKMKGVKRSRAVGHRPKHNKKSVDTRKRLRKEKAKKEESIVE